MINKDEMKKLDFSDFRFRSWWDGGLKDVTSIKNRIEEADRAGIHCITISGHKIHAIAYFASFGFEIKSYETVDGYRAKISWDSDTKPEVPVEIKIPAEIQKAVHGRVSMSYARPLKDPDTKQPEVPVEIKKFMNEYTKKPSIWSMIFRNGK